MEARGPCGERQRAVEGELPGDEPQGAAGNLRPRAERQDAAEVRRPGDEPQDAAASGSPQREPQDAAASRSACAGRRDAAESVRALAARHGLSGGQAAALERLLVALAAEPDPPTRITDPRDAIDRHLADSLTALQLDEVRGARRIADLGAGAGFPGLPLAVALPSAEVDLVESSRRKCEVIERLVRAATASNAHAVPARAEEWATREGHEAYDVVTARALAALAVLVEYAAPLLAPGGVLVAWKGSRDGAEEHAGRRAAEAAGLRWAEVLRVVPFADAHSRHLHVARKVAATPVRLPRRPGVALRRPLG